MNREPFNDETSHPDGQVVKLLQGMQEQLESEVGTVVVIECDLNLTQQTIQKCILSIYVYMNIHCRYIYNVSHKYIYTYSLCIYIHSVNESP